MKHPKSKFILSGAATVIVLMAVIISGPRNVFAAVLSQQLNHSNITSTWYGGFSETLPATTGTVYSMDMYMGASPDGYFGNSFLSTITVVEAAGGAGNCSSIWKELSNADYSIPYGSGNRSVALIHFDFSTPVTLSGEACPIRLRWGEGYSGAIESMGDDGAGHAYAVMYDSGGPVLPDTSTHFISITPTNGTTTATTTTLTQHVYVNSSDLSSTTAVRTVYRNAYCSSFSGAVIDALSNSIGQGCSFTFTWNVASAGENSSSTPVTFVYGGTWQYISTIYDTVGTWCIFGYCLSSETDTLRQVSGSFVVGQPNALDVIQGYIASSSGALATLASSTAAISSICNPISGSFSLGSCVYLLIIPDASSTSALISGVSGKFLTYVPLGYVTRFIAIFASGTTTPLPVFSYTPPAVLGYSQGAITLNPWNLFSTTSFIGSLTSSTSTGSRTLRSIAEPYWNFLWTLVLAIAIIGRITGIYPHFHSRGLPQNTATKDRKGFKHVNDETYRYEEQLYKISKRK